MSGNTQRFQRLQQWARSRLSRCKSNRQGSPFDCHQSEATGPHVTSCAVPRRLIPALDGTYVLRTNLKAEALDSGATVKAYNALVRASPVFI